MIRRRGQGGAKAGGSQSPPSEALAINRGDYLRGIGEQNWRIRRAGENGEGVLATRIAVDPTLPPLAWLCTREGRSYQFRIGRGIERFDDGFFEGVWAGDFADFSNAHRRTHYGSGVLVRKSVLFLPPKHVLECLFILRDHARRTDYISNSLCFCLAAGAPAIDPGYWQSVVDKTLQAASLGVYRYDPTVLSDDRYTLLRVMHNNFRFTRTGNIRFAPRYPGLEFEQFSDYRDHLTATIATLFANGAHSRRRFRFKPIVSLSRGYDSPAAAVLARDAGCMDALSIRGKVRGMEDSGREIGESLGLNVTEFDNVISTDIARLELSYAGALEEKAQEFIATAGIGDDLTFLALEPELEGRILLTGVWGDSIWARNSTVAPGLPTRTPFGKSLTEFRLRVGFAHVPVPMIGAFYPPSIVSISNSPPMLQQYSVGGRYDRPIPRRIVEEAGVARDEFGTAKNAISPDPTDRQDLWPRAMAAVMKRYQPVG